MGLRATSVKKYEIEYGDIQGFNYDPETLANIITYHCKDYFLGGDGEDGYSLDAIWDIDKDEFLKMVETISAMDEDEFREISDNEWCSEMDMDDDFPYTQEELVALLKDYYNDTPENSKYVRIAWL